jgi:Protein of unknown function (DUF2905)
VHQAVDGGTPLGMNLEAIGRLVAGIGVALVVVGALLWLGGRLGLGRLPGDLVMRRGSVTVMLPLATCLLLSVVGTIVLNLFLRR